MKVSYQDIATQVASLQDKVEFILKTFTVTKQYESVLVPGQVVRESKTLLDVYHELKGQGAVVNPFAEPAGDSDAALVKE